MVNLGCHWFVLLLSISISCGSSQAGEFFSIPIDTYANSTSKEALMVTLTRSCDNGNDDHSTRNITGEGIQEPR